MKYSSITTPHIEHDAANMLTEFIWLNRNIRSEHYPWRGENTKEWGRIVAALKKLMRYPYELSAEQLAFYIWKCKPKQINPPEFAKMAVVARRLLEHYDLDQVSTLYKRWREDLSKSSLQNVQYKQEKPKSLLSFLRELEIGKTSQES